jgi:hypothetical protein
LMAATMAACRSSGALNTSSINSDLDITFPHRRLFSPSMRKDYDTRITATSERPRRGSAFAERC